MKNSRNLLSYLFIALMLTSFIACEKDDIDEETEVSLPQIETKNVSDITSASAIVGADLTDDGAGTISQKGVCYSKNPNPTVDGNKVNSGSNEDVFNCQLKNLDPSTEYYVRAFATNEKGTSYGAEKKFQTTVQGTNSFSANLNGSSFGIQTLNVSNAGGKISITAMSGAGAERIVVWMPSNPVESSFSADYSTSDYYLSYMQNTNEVFYSDNGTIEITSYNDLTGKIEGNFDVTATYNDSTVTVSNGNFSVYK